MIWKWAMMIVLAVEAAAWLAYGALKAFNGILREVEILKLLYQEGN